MNNLGQWPNFCSNKLSPQTCSIEHLLLLHFVLGPFPSMYHSYTIYVYQCISVVFPCISGVYHVYTGCIQLYTITFQPVKPVIQFWAQYFCIFPVYRCIPSVYRSHINLFLLPTPVFCSLLSYAHQLPTSRGRLKNSTTQMRDEESMRTRAKFMHSERKEEKGLVLFFLKLTRSN